MSDPDDISNLQHVDMSVRELLTEMKDTSEVIVDLAYASLMYNSDNMAQKVRDLEDDMDDLKFAIRYKALLSSRTKEDARQLSGLLEVASAADRISNAASDIVSLLRFPPEKRPLITDILLESDERIRMIRVKPESTMVGNTIERLAIEANTGCKIIAIKNRSINDLDSNIVFAADAEGAPRDLYATINYSYAGHDLGSANVYKEKAPSIRRPNFIHIYNIHISYVIIFAVILALILVVSYFTVSRRKRKRAPVRARSNRQG